MEPPTAVDHYSRHAPREGYVNFHRITKTTVEEEGDNSGNQAATPCYEYHCQMPGCGWQGATSNRAYSHANRHHPGPPVHTYWVLRRSREDYNRQQREKKRVKKAQVQARRSRLDSKQIWVAGELVDKETGKPSGEGVIYQCQCRVVPGPSMTTGPRLVGRLEKDFEESCLVAISWAMNAFPGGLGR